MTAASAGASLRMFWPSSIATDGRQPLLRRGSALLAYGSRATHRLHLWLTVRARLTGWHPARNSSLARASLKARRKIRWTCAPRVQGCCHDKGDLFAFEERFTHEGCYPDPPQGVVCYPLSEAHRSSRRDVLEQVGRRWTFQQSLARVRLTMSLRRPSANLMRHILGQSGSGTMPSALSVTVISPAASPDRGEAPDCTPRRFQRTGGTSAWRCSRYRKACSVSGDPAGGRAEPRRATLRRERLAAGLAGNNLRATCSDVGSGHRNIPPLSKARSASVGAGIGLATATVSAGIFRPLPRARSRGERPPQNWAQNRPPSYPDTTPPAYTCPPSRSNASKTGLPRRSVHGLLNLSVAPNDWRRRGRRRK
jgi:hypothetical protein